MVATKTSTFQVVLEGCRGPHLREKFVRDGGLELVADLLEDAGLGSGKWSFRILNGVHSGGATPPIQVKRSDINGVHIWLKPGSSASGVKGLLVVSRDKEMAPDAVFRKLYAALKARGQAPNGCYQVDPGSLPREEEILVDDEELALVLVGIDAVPSSTPVSTYTDFAQLVLKQVGGVRSVAELLDIFALCRDNDWVISTGCRYVRTPAGAAFVKETLREEDAVAVTTVEEKPSTQRASKPPVEAPVIAGPPASPASPEEHNDEAAQRVLWYKDKLLALAKVGDEVAKSRERQFKLKKDIKNLQADLLKEEKHEGELTKGVNLEALEALFGPPGK